MVLVSIELTVKNTRVLSKTTFMKAKESCCIITLTGTMGAGKPEKGKVMAYCQPKRAPSRFLKELGPMILTRRERGRCGTRTSGVKANSLVSSRVATPMARERCYTRMETGTTAAGTRGRKREKEK